MSHFRFIRGRLLVFALILCLGYAEKRGEGGVALTMQGGGFRALATDSGLLAGALAAMHQRNISQPTLAESGLLERFNIISTVSGSSWFAAELLYSKRFLALVEGMASSPQTAAEQFGANWTSAWLAAIQLDPSKFRLRKDIAEIIVRVLLGTGDEDSVFMAAFFLSSGASWNEFVHVLLNSTADLDDDMVLGGAVQKWAEGKIWLVDHTAMYPNLERPGVIYSDNGKPTASEVSYVSTDPFLPYFYPAKFSITLGSGPKASAPVDYMAPGLAVASSGLVYTSNASFFVGRDVAPPMDLDKARVNFMRFAGMLPLNKVVATSSAFLGSAAILGPLAGDLQTLLFATATPWVSSAPDGLAFDIANDLVSEVEAAVNEQTVANLAKFSVHGLIDGGETDGSGIANAVAAGADEVLVVLNSYSTNFVGYIMGLFPGAPPPPNPFVPTALFPVFESPSSATLQNLLNQSHLLSIPTKTRYLTVFAIASLHATTAHNKFFGIESGRNVTVHVINIASELSIGEIVDFHHYDQLTSEIVSTILSEDNAQFVSDTLLPIFLGAGISQQQDTRIV